MLFFNIVCGVGGGGNDRQVTLHSRETTGFIRSVQKRQKCKFVIRLLSMILDFYSFNLNNCS